MNNGSPSEKDSKLLIQRRVRRNTYKTFLRYRRHSTSSCNIEDRCGTSTVQIPESITVFRLGDVGECDATSGRGRCRDQFHIITKEGGTPALRKNNVLAIVNAQL